MDIKPYLREVSLKHDQINNIEEYPFNIPAISELGTLNFHPDVTFFVGENGSGKSTLLESIAFMMGFGSEGGTKNTLFSTADTVSNLHHYLKIVKNFSKPDDHYFLRAESFYNVASYMDETGYLNDYGGKSLHQQSHGESFMATLLHKLKGNGLYLFDEPEAALSPSRQMAAISAIHQLVENGSQFIIATHSPILLAYPRSKIMQFDEMGISEVRYKDTEHYVITKEFLNHHQDMIKYLIEDDLD